MTDSAILSVHALLYYCVHRQSAAMPVLTLNTAHPVFLRTYNSIQQYIVLFLSAFVDFMIYWLTTVARTCVKLHIHTGIL